MEGTFVAEDIHLPHVYVDRIVKGHSYEKRIEVRNLIIEILLVILSDCVPASQSAETRGGGGRGAGSQ